MAGPVRFPQIGPARPYWNERGGFGTGALRGEMPHPDGAVSQPEGFAKGGADQDFSLVRGGPFYRLQQAAGLIDANRWNLGRRAVFALAIGWAPLVILTALFHPHLLIGLLKDYRVYARVVIAIPVLLAGQTLLESRFRLIVQHLRNAKLLSPDDLAYMYGVVATLVRWGDSWLPELLIILMVYLNTAAIWHERVAEHWAWGIIGAGASAHITPAGWYFGLVSQAIYRFLVGLGLWKWLLATFYLFKLSRLDLKLVATHPDHHGGIGFLGLAPMGFAPIAFAISAAIGSNWREQILHDGAHLMAFKFQAVVLLAVILIMALGPLVFFVPRLAKLRRWGSYSMEYSRNPQYGLPPEVDFASRRARGGVLSCSRSQYPYRLRKQLREHRGDAAVSV